MSRGSLSSCTFSQAFFPLVSHFTTSMSVVTHSVTLAPHVNCPEDFTSVTGCKQGAAPPHPSPRGYFLSDGLHAPKEPHGHLLPASRPCCLWGLPEDKRVHSWAGRVPKTLSQFERANHTVHALRQVAFGVLANYRCSFLEKKKKVLGK